jgi:hypothetical protein
MKLHADDLAALHNRREPPAVLGDGNRVARDGRGEAVREIQLRAGSQAVGDR